MMKNYVFCLLKWKQMEELNQKLAAVMRTAERNTIAIQDMEFGNKPRIAKDQVLEPNIFLIS